MMPISYQSAKRALDTAFSIYIRLRDRIPTTDFCRCISCGKNHRWKEMHAGHYINRGNMAVRWNENNVHAQCVKCNTFDEGNIPMYHLALEKKIGKDKIALLLAAKNKRVKYSAIDLKIMANEYKRLTSEMKRSALDAESI